MNAKLLLLLGIIIGLSGCAGSGNSGASGEQEVDVRVVDSVNSTEAKADADPNEVVCTRRHQVGSNFPKMICKTRKEIEQERAAADRALSRERSINAANRIDPARGG